MMQKGILHSAAYVEGCMQHGGLEGIAGIAICSLQDWKELADWNCKLSPSTVRRWFNASHFQISSNKSLLSICNAFDDIAFYRRAHRIFVLAHMGEAI